MHLKSLKIQFFRNYLDLKLEFGPATTVIVGPNAKGKTNLLEAIFMLAVGKSFRAHRQLEVINWDNRDFSRLEAVIQRSEIRGLENQKSEELAARPRRTYRDSRLELIMDNRAGFHKVAKVDGVETRLVEFIGTLRAVLFLPEDLNLVSGAPALRRRYFDVALSQLDKKYVYALLQYDKILKNRNKLLQNIAAGISKEGELCFWNQELAKEAAYIIQRRALAVKSWNEKISEIYQQFASEQKFDFEVRYKTCIGLSSTSEEAITKKLAEELANNQKKELERGYTEVGPHREDFHFYLNGRSLGLYGSRGECRTAVLTLKLQELNYLKGETGDQPIFLLDDVFSELDKSRRQALLDHISGGQTIITTTDAGYFKGMEESLEVREMESLL